MISCGFRVFVEVVVQLRELQMDGRLLRVCTDEGAPQALGGLS